MKIKERLGITLLEHVGTVPLDRVTGGDISREGQWIILRSEAKAFMWKRLPGQSVDLQVSPNLSSWRRLKQLVLTGDPIVIEDPESYERLFYRLVLP